MTDAAGGSRPGGSQVATRSRSSAWVCVAAIAIGSLLSIVLRWMVALKPLSVAVDPYDDGLFERAAVALSNHQWLGPLDQLTLAKGPAFPAFVVVTHKLGIPLQVGVQITYLVAAGVLALCVWLVTRRLVACTVVYLIVAFDPVNFTEFGARVGRDSWYAALSLLVVSALFATTWCVVHRAGLRRTVPLAVLTGLGGAAFWLCREEGVWIVPSALVIVVGLPLTRLPGRARDPDRLRPGRRDVLLRVAAVGAVVAVVAVTFAAPIAYVGAKNRDTYGVSLITDYASGAFADAYSAWSRVRGVPLEDYVPIDRAQREAVYAVSPTARELRPVLDAPVNGWRQFGCDSVNVCDDFAGGWTQWAIRDAARSIGRFDDEPEFQAFFAQLATEINAACDSGQLQCTPNLPSAMQPLLRASVLPTVRSALYWLGQLPTNETFSTEFGPGQTFLISDAERATLRQAITGVPATDAEALAGTANDDQQRWIYVFLGRAFVVLFLALLAMSVLGLALGLWWRKDRARNLGLWVLSLALGAGVLARLVLLAVVDTTQFLIVAKYHFPTRAFLLALAAIGAVNLVHVLRSHFAARPTVDPEEPALAGRVPAVRP